MKNTITIPVSDINEVARTAYDGFITSAQSKWDKAVFEFWGKNKNSRYFWVGKHKWQTIKDVEIYLGKPKIENGFIYHSSLYYMYWHSTEQSNLYKSIVDLYENKEDAIITITIEDYNTLRTYG